MQSRLAKTLYLGLAALSLGAVASVSTTASAKSKAKVVSTKPLKTAPETRNVQVTGTNAIYSKPGTVKGAKIVASKKTVKKLANSKKSADYFRAYSMQVTNKGSVYYKVVAMNGKHRGYIYGGKKDTVFAGGIKSATTTQTANLPANTTVYFAKPGKTNVTWSAPKYTQYKASKQAANTLPFAKDTLTVTKAETKTREGSLYYYVEDAAHPSINGWIYSGALTTTQNTFDAKSDVKVNFQTTSGAIVKSTTLAGLKANDGGKVATKVGTAVGTDAANQATDAWGAAALAGTGYAYKRSDSMNNAALTAAKSGDTITLYVTQNVAQSTKINFYAVTNDLSQQGKQLKAYTKSASATTVAFPALTNMFAGAKDSTYTANDVQAYLTANNLTTLYTPSYTVGNDKVYMKYTFNSAPNGIYGSTNAKAFYTGTQENGASPVDTMATTTSANQDYVG